MRCAFNYKGTSSHQQRFPRKHNLTDFQNLIINWSNSRALISTAFPTAGFIVKFSIISNNNKLENRVSLERPYWTGSTNQARPTGAFRVFTYNFSIWLYWTRKYDSGAVFWTCTYVLSSRSRRNLWLKALMRSEVRWKCLPVWNNNRNAFETRVIAQTTVVIVVML